MKGYSNGGPAFPGKYVKHAPGEVGNNVAIVEDGEGMTLRDYFAAKVMHSVIAYSHGDVDTSDGSKFAAQAYRFADAMLAERAK